MVTVNVKVINYEQYKDSEWSNNNPCVSGWAMLSKHFMDTAYLLIAIPQIN